MSKHQPTASQQVIARLGAAIAHVAVASEFVTQMSACPPTEKEAREQLTAGAVQQAEAASALLASAQAEVETLIQALKPRPVIVLPRS